MHQNQEAQKSRWSYLREMHLMNNYKKVTTLQLKQNSLYFPCFFQPQNLTFDILVSIYTIPNVAEPIAKTSFHYWAVLQLKICFKAK